MLEFTTAVKEADESEDQVLEFKLDGRIMKARRPGSGQMTLMLASLAPGNDDTTAMAAYIGMFFSMFERADREHLERRLLDREDSGFEWEQIRELSEMLLEEWGGRPFESRSDLPPSPSPDGPKSTLGTTKLI